MYPWVIITYSYNKMGYDISHISGFYFDKCIYWINIIYINGQEQKEYYKSNVAYF